VEPNTVAVILNPAAGAGKTLRLLPKVTSALKSLDRPYKLHVTTRAGEALDVAQDFAHDGASAIIAVGGDGTINEVANGIVASGQRTPMGVVAGGHGSDFARAIGVPKDVVAAIRRATSGVTRPVDLGRVTFEDGKSRLFINAAGLGFDAEVARRAYRSRLPGGKLPYLAAVAGALVYYRNVDIVVTCDNERLSERAMFALVANSRYLAGGLQLAPMAAVDDGLLDLTLVGDISKLDLIAQVPKVFRGTHTGHPKYWHRRIQCARVETSVPAHVQLDGELVGTSPVTFSVEAGAISIAG